MIAWASLSYSLFLLAITLDYSCINSVSNLHSGIVLACISRVWYWLRRRLLLRTYTLAFDAFLDMPK